MIHEQADDELPAVRGGHDFPAVPAKAWRAGRRGARLYQSDTVVNPMCWDYRLAVWLRWCQ